MQFLEEIWWAWEWGCGRKFKE